MAGAFSLAHRAGCDPKMPGGASGLAMAPTISPRALTDMTAPLSAMMTALSGLDTCQITAQLPAEPPITPESEMERAKEVRPSPVPQGLASATALWSCHRTAATLLPAIGS